MKCSMFYKMPGDLETKAANLKTAYTFMMGQPGKKLLFMGQEFGQREEWSEARGLDWYLLDEPMHKDIQNYYRELLHLYKDNPVMYAYETSEYECFRWINCDDGDNSVFSFIRKAPGTFNGSLAFVCNFTPIERGEYVIGVPHPGEYKVILSSEDVAGVERVTYTAEELPEGQKQDNFDYKLTVKLRSFESIVMEVPKQVIKKPVRTVKKKTTKKDKE